jgi:hypothetical protein
MRNELGQYVNTKPILSNGPEWAEGCDLCNVGIVSAPELTGAVSTALERLVQAIEHDITFCDCTAGKMYRISLLNLRQRLIEEARKSPLMQAQALRGSHPDIEIAQQKILAAHMSAPVPTMHMSGEPAHA